MITTDTLERLNDAIAALDDEGFSVEEITDVESTEHISNKAVLKVTWE